MKLILIRHCETDGNKKEILQGQLDVDLNLNGIKQARKLAERLKKEKIDAFYSSDLKRARKTAEEIAKYHKSRLYITELIRERKFGFFEGMKISDYQKIVNQWNIPHHKFRPPFGESYEDVLKRVKKFYSYIVRKHKNDTVAVVSHGALNRVMLSHILGISLKEARELPQENSCINVIEINGSKARLISLNDCKHIKP